MRLKNRFKDFDEVRIFFAKHTSDLEEKINSFLRENQKKGEFMVSDIYFHTRIDNLNTPTLFAFLLLKRILGQRTGLSSHEEAQH